MNLTDLSDLIKSRRSIRTWQDKPVNEDTLLRAVELATYAPNAGNQQNWHFYVILKKETIVSIADAVQASAEYIASLPEIGTWPDVARGMVQRASTFRNAPAAIAVAVKQYNSQIDQVVSARPAEPKSCLIRQWRDTANSKIQSVSSAIAYLLLILHQMGLGAVWMTGPMQAKGDIEQILGVPDGMDIIAFIPVGYPAENPPLKGEKTGRGYHQRYSIVLKKTPGDSLDGCHRYFEFKG
jgi:nitroreductase